MKFTPSGTFFVPDRCTLIRPKGGGCKYKLCSSDWHKARLTREHPKNSAQFAEASAGILVRRRILSWGEKYANATVCSLVAACVDTNCVRAGGVKQ